MSRSWIFQANPKYNLSHELTNTEKPITWRIKNYFSKIEKGDRIYFWQSGENAGLYGWGIAESEPFVVSNEKQINLQYMGVWNPYISKNKIVENQKLANMSILKAPKSANAFKIKKEEAVELNRLLPRLNNAGEWHAKGLTELGNKQFLLARESFEEAIRLDSKNPEYLYNLGYCLMQLNDLSEAQISLEHCVQINPKYNTHAWVILGSIHMQLGNSESAFYSLDQALMINPNDIEALLEKSILYNSLNDPERELQTLTQIIALDKDNFVALDKKAFLLNEAGEFNKAIELLERAIKLAPTFDKPYFNLGCSFLRTKRFYSAVVNLIKALELNAENFHAWYTLGFTYEEMQLLDQAFLAYNNAVIINPDLETPFKPNGIFNDITDSELWFIENWEFWKGEEEWIEIDRIGNDQVNGKMQPEMDPIYWLEEEKMENFLPSIISPINSARSIKRFQPIRNCKNLFDALNQMWIAHNSYLKQSRLSDNQSIKDLALFGLSKKFWNDLFLSKELLTLASFEPHIMNHQTLIHGNYIPHQEINSQLKHNATKEHRQLRNAYNRYLESQSVENQEALLKKTTLLLYVVRSNIAHGVKTRHGPDEEKIKRDKEISKITYPLLELMLDLLLNKPSEKLIIYSGRNDSRSKYIGILKSLNGDWKEGQTHGKVIEQRNENSYFDWNLGEPKICLDVFLSNQLKDRIQILDFQEGNLRYRILVPTNIGGKLVICNVYTRRLPRE